MGAVVEVQDRIVRLSIARLAEEFGMARETVSKRLALSNVSPDGKRNGYPVYRLRDACPAILQPLGLGEDGEVDPRKLPPSDRNAWYQSELRRVDLELKSQQLIPAAEFEAGLADMAKDLVQFLETLADQLERDAGLTPEQIDALHLSIDRQRQSLYERIVAEEGEAAVA
jgi:hypothetical protein